MIGTWAGCDKESCSSQAVKLGVNNGSGGGGSCFGIEVWTDTAKLTNMLITRFGER